MTRISLLARAIVLPASIAASTASRAAVPEDANSTIVDVGMRRAASRPSGPLERPEARAPRGGAAPLAASASARRVAIAIVSGANCCDLIGEPRDVLARRQRDDAQPVGVRRDDGQRALTDRSGRAEDGDAASSELQVPDEDVVDRRGKQPAVDPIEHAAVARNERRSSP